MSDDTSGDAPPARRVVKRVVRRTVVAPPPPTRSAPADDRPATDPVAAEPTVDDVREPDPSRPAAHRDRPTLSLPSVTLPRLSWPSGIGLRRRGGEVADGDTATDDGDGPDPDRAAVVTRAAETAADPGPWHDDEPARVAGPARRVPRPSPVVLVRRGGERSRQAASSALDRVAAQPHPVVAGLVGLLLGVAVTVVGWVAVVVFDVLLGTPSGGGWGLLVLVGLGIAAVLAGGRALRAAGVPEPAMTSVLAVLVVPVVVLGLFLDASTTGWVAVIVPVLGSAAFAAVQPVTARLSTAHEER